MQSAAMSVMYVMYVLYVLYVMYVLYVVYVMYVQMHMHRFIHIHNTYMYIYNVHTYA